MNDRKAEPEEVVQSFLSYLNAKSDDFILKGGTALFMCYGSKRFSKDIDLDGKVSDIGNYIEEFCKEHHYGFRTTEDTDITKNFIIDYGNEKLKIKTSFRKKYIAREETTKINGVNVYRINPLCVMKVNAYMSRDKLCDLYDILFIAEKYFDELEPTGKSLLQNALLYKGIEYFDYIVSQHYDELINASILAEAFIEILNKLDLICINDEKEILGIYTYAEKRRN